MKKKEIFQRRFSVWTKLRTKSTRTRGGSFSRAHYKTQTSQTKVLKKVVCRSDWLMFADLMTFAEATQLDDQISKNLRKYWEAITKEQGQNSELVLCHLIEKEHKGVEDIEKLFCEDMYPKVTCRRPSALVKRALIWCIEHCCPDWWYHDWSWDAWKKICCGCCKATNMPETSTTGQSDSLTAGAQEQKTKERKKKQVDKRKKECVRPHLLPSVQRHSSSSHAGLSSNMHFTV